jgi:chromosome partitioning protein
MPIIAVANHKGGVGKTTCTLNLAAALQGLGRRVLLVDMDPQGSLSVACGIVDVDAVHLSLGELLVARARRTPFDVVAAIVQSPCGLDLIPGNSMLSAAELIFAEVQDRQALLSDVLAPSLPAYDYVLIDCLPSLGLMAINALHAASGVVIPVQADFLAVQGLVQMLETVSEIRGRLNPGLEIYGILLTMVDLRSPHARRVVGAVRRSLKHQVPIFQTEILYDVALKDMTELGKTIFELDSGKRSAKLYRTLAREVAVAAGDASASVDADRGGVIGNLVRSFGRLGRRHVEAEVNGPSEVRAA